MADDGARDVVIGVGNPLMGDDGIGLVALCRLQDEWDVGDDVLLVDGGTWGMNLLPTIESARHLLLLDAIDARMPAGSDVILVRDEIPRYFAHKLSPHQIDLRETLALAELRGTLPDETVAVGLQPERVELSLELSPVVAEHIDRLVALARRQLEQWGHRVTRRANPSRRAGVLTPAPDAVHA
jgi:hydrogenase maturation protease